MKNLKLKKSKMRSLIFSSTLVLALGVGASIPSENSTVAAQQVNELGPNQEERYVIQAPATLVVGESGSASTTTLSDGSVYSGPYASTNPPVLAVSEDGTYEAIAEGVARISIIEDGTIILSEPVTVIAEESEVVPDPPVETPEDPEPRPDPEPSPEPTPEPIPEPEPTPELTPEPDPIPDSEPAPKPTPEPDKDDVLEESEKTDPVKPISDSKDKVEERAPESVKPAEKATADSKALYPVKDAGAEQATEKKVEPETSTAGERLPDTAANFASLGLAGLGALAGGLFIKRKKH